MSKSLNKVMLIGNVGVDPKIITTAVSKIASFTLATTEKVKTQAGEIEDKTEWHKITCFGKLADIIEMYVKKGAKLYIAGSLRTSKWQTSDGSNRYTTEIIGKEMIMLDKLDKKENTEDAFDANSFSMDLPENKFLNKEEDIPF
jgi:single-strand DNA-binding protein